MSHFSVIVVTKEKPTDESLAAALQPFHEYESTGVDDQYVIDIDVSDEVTTELASSAECVRKPDGKIRSRYSDEFYTKEGEPDCFGMKRKEFELPAGCEIISMTKDALRIAEGQSVEEFAKDYGGYFRKPDGRFYRTTNPNKTWDHWSIGGRYTGKFIPNYDAYEDPQNKERCWLCNGTGLRNDPLGFEARQKDPAYTCNGCSGTGKMVKHAPDFQDTGNQIRVGDIPWDLLRASKVKKATDEYDKAAAATKGMDLPDWDSMRDTLGIDEARKAYHESPAIVALRKLNYFETNEIIETLRMSRDAVITRATSQPVTCWALLDENGVWSEKGKMGWFGMSSGDKDELDWTFEVNKKLESLPADYWLTVVDCHI